MLKILGCVLVVGGLVLLTIVNVITIDEPLTVTEQTLVEVQKTRYTAEIALGFLLILLTEVQERLPRRTTQTSTAKSVASE